MCLATITLITLILETLDKSYQVYEDWMKASGTTWEARFILKNLILKYILIELQS